MIPPVRGGRRDPFPKSNGTEVVETVTENITAVAATDIAAAEAGTVIVTETKKGIETGSTAATITNADAVAKTEKKTVAGETVTVIETKGITGSDEGRGKTK